MDIDKERERKRKWQKLNPEKMRQHRVKYEEDIYHGDLTTWPLKSWQWADWMQEVPTNANFWMPVMVLDWQNMSVALHHQSLQ